MNRRRIDHRSDLEAWRIERERIDRELAKLLTAIKSGGPIEAIVVDMNRLEARKAELADLLASADEPPPLLHPNMVQIYHQRLSALHDQLQSDETKSEAAETFRSLVDRVELLPEGNDLAIVLRGDLAAILRFAANKKNPDVLSEADILDDLLWQKSSPTRSLQSGRSDPESPGSVVAGGRHTRSLRNRKNAKNDPLGSPLAVSQESVVAGIRRLPSRRYDGPSPVERRC